MKRFSLPFVIALVSLALSACAPSTAVTPAQRAQTAAQLASQAKNKQVAPDISTTTGYQFAGTDNRNQACSTGPHAFHTPAQMCINLQDPVQNHQCALDKRTAKFQKECAPAFGWQESLSCHFALLDPAAFVTPTGTYPARYEKEAGDLCAGRTPGGLELPGTSAAGVPLIDDILYDVDLAFAPAGAATSSHFRMSIYRKDAAGKKTALAPDFEFTGGFKAASGKLTGAAYEYVFRCDNTWACAGGAP